MLKGMKLFKKNKQDAWESLEELLVIFLFIGVSMIVLGLLVSIWFPQGLGAIAALVGGLISFISLSSLVIVWFAHEGFK